MQRLAQLIATTCYVGYLKPAPGTWGSLAAFPIGYALWAVGGFWLFLAAIPIAFVKGLWATNHITQGADDHDPSEIVIDEVVGQWIALLPVALGAYLTGNDPLALYPGLIAAFALFRLFDIMKPGPIGWADQRADALGVMLDDVIAGWCAALLVAVLAFVAHLPAF